MSGLFFITTVAVLVYMAGWFIAAQLKGRNDIADIAWGPGFIVAAAASLLASGLYPPRGMLVSALVLVWGVRLAVHIHARHRDAGLQKAFEHPLFAGLGEIRQGGRIPHPRSGTIRVPVFRRGQDHEARVAFDLEDFAGTWQGFLWRWRFGRPGRELHKKRCHTQ